MLKFFLNIKFWMPLVIVLFLAIIFDGILRLGHWDDYVRPKSYLGNAIYREKAIRNFGLENIHWISIGDSRFDWGIEHDKIKKAQYVNGLNHLRMSFESSNFMAIQATIDWSIRNMPNLKGIMLGVSEDSFAHYSAVTNQYKVAWPFRSFINYDKYQYFDFKNNLYSYIARNAIAVYFEDIRFFFRDMLKRFKNIDDFIKSDFKKILEFNRNIVGNMCQYQINDLNQCIKLAQDLHSNRNKLSGAEKFIYKVCYNQHSIRQPNKNFKSKTLNRLNKTQLIQKWKAIFDNIDKNNIELNLVYLPDNRIFNYVIKPTNAHEISNELFNYIRKLSHVNILDLSEELGQDNTIKTCQLYKDPLHFNNFGKTIVTQKIIEKYFSLRNNLAN